MTKNHSSEQQYKFYFKLFNNLKDESEVELARRELTALFGRVEDVPNIIDEFVSGELPQATLRSSKEGKRLTLQDAVTYELPYGNVHGFKGTGNPSILAKLVRRLAYSREIYIVIPKEASGLDLGNLVPGVNLFHYEAGNKNVVRAISTQFFLEKSQYISKLSRNKDEIDRNLDTLMNFLREQSDRIPATETMAVGRRLEDWFGIREEPSLYLTHYMHPYKGKFHPKMARALINYTCPNDEGKVLDNFSGSGTTLVEAQWLGLDSVGVDINPLSSLMSQVKVQCLEVGSAALRSAIQEFLGRLRETELEVRATKGGQATLSKSHLMDRKNHADFAATLPASVKRDVSDEQLSKILTAKGVLEFQFGKLNGNMIHEFLLLGLSGAISDVSRRTSQDFFDVLEDRLKHLLGRVHLAERLLSKLKVNRANGECFVGDTRDLSRLKTLGGKPREIKESSIDCVVNSPPYSTALDYIRNDLPQLSILNLNADMQALERDLMGNPNLKVYDKELQMAIIENKLPFSQMPNVGKDILMRMLAAGRRQEAGRVLKFWVDMRQTLGEIRRVLRPGGRAAIVIGDNNIQLVKGSGRFEQVPNAKVLQELSREIGLSVVEVIAREIEKSMTGMIRNEAITIFQK